MQSAYFAVIVGITPGEGTRPILTAFLLTLRVAFVALPFAIKIERFLLLFALLVSLWEREVSAYGGCGERLILCYLTADFASLFVSQFSGVCERGHRDGRCCRCCVLVRVKMRH